MSEKIFAFVTIIICLAIMSIMQIITPKLTRRDLFFGVRIPKEAIDSDDTKKIFKEYVRNNIIFGSLYIVLTGVLFYFVFMPVELVALIFGDVILVYVLYFISYKKTKVLKKEKQWDKLIKNNMVIIDTEFSKNKNGKLVASKKWFIIPIIMIIINFIITYICYPGLPDKIPTHWGFHGVDAWSAKSYTTVFIHPVMQCILLVLLYVSYLSIGMSKQQSSTNNTKNSLEKNKIFRYYSSMIMVITTIFVELMLSYLNYIALLLFKMNNVIMIVLVVLILSTAVVSVFIQVKFGQGGNKIKLKGDDSIIEVEEKNDDKYWILGFLYYNKQDPALFVEKRFGVGWTVNFGSALGLALVLLPIILLIGLLIVSIFKF